MSPRKPLKTRVLMSNALQRILRTPPGGGMRLLANINLSDWTVYGKNVISQPHHGRCPEDRHHHTISQRAKAFFACVVLVCVCVFFLHVASILCRANVG